MARETSRRSVARWVVAIHSLLAILVLLIVIQSWGKFGAGTSDLWLIFLLIDFPMAWFYFPLDGWLLPLDLGVQFRFVTLPFLTALLLGGVQWYTIVRIVELCGQCRRPEAGKCNDCGYNLTGNVSGVCPECGMEVAGEQPNPYPRQDSNL